LDEQNFIHKSDDFFKGTHYCCCYYFLIESSCHVTFKVNVIISHRNFFFYYLQKTKNKQTNKHLGKATNLHLHYHANPLLALLLQAQIFIIPISSLVPSFHISSPDLGTFRIMKNKGWKQIGDEIGYENWEEFVDNFIVPNLL
jgi:hypothetical protein